MDRDRCHRLDHRGSDILPCNIRRRASPSTNSAQSRSASILCASTIVSSAPPASLGLTDTPQRDHIDWAQCPVNPPTNCVRVFWCQFDGFDSLPTSADSLRSHHRSFAGLESKLEALPRLLWQHTDDCIFTNTERWEVIRQGHDKCRSRPGQHRTQVSEVER